MLKRLLRGWYWMRAIELSRKGDTVGALRHINAIEESFMLRPYELAFRGTLLLRQRKMTEAKECFVQTIEMTGAPASNNANYTLLFSTALLHGMHGMLTEEKDALEKARNIRCSALLRRWLPLYDLGGLGRVAPDR
jgi:hypothetical protein